MQKYENQCIFLLTLQQNKYFNQNPLLLDCSPELQEEEAGAGDSLGEGPQACQGQEGEDSHGESAVAKEKAGDGGQAGQAGEEHPLQDGEGGLCNHCG